MSRDDDPGQGEADLTGFRSVGSKLIRDARGRAVSMIDPMRMQMLHQDDVIDRATLDEMMEELEPGLSRNLRMTIITIVLGIGALAVLVFLVWFMNPGRRAGLAKTLTHNPGMWIAIVAGVVVPMLAVRKKHQHRLPALMLKHRRCPHCGYNLSGLNPDDADGATICPECACAWRLAEAGAPAMEAAPVAGPSTGVKIGLVISLLLGMAAFAGVLFMRQAGSINWMAVGWMAGGAVVVLGIIFASIALVRRPK